MKITLQYRASWRNSFLDGDNNQPLPKKGRKYIASMTGLKNAKNYIQRDTVMGVLNRLIGDQQKLYQARSECYQPYYFKDIEPLITFEDHPKHRSTEMVYLRNMNNSYDQNSFTGAITPQHPLLASDYSQELWGVLGLEVDEIGEFILNSDYQITQVISLHPLDLLERIKQLDKLPPIKDETVIKAIIEQLAQDFPEMKYTETNGFIKPMRLFAVSLYLQQQRLQQKYDMTSVLSKRNTLVGFSKRGFNGARDFIKNFTTTGKPKKIWGNPYIRKQRIKGQGEVVSMLSKVDGQLDIHLDIDRTKAKELKKMINNAGVSSFYLGKKGLAYVSKIRL